MIRSQGILIFQTYHVWKNKNKKQSMNQLCGYEKESFIMDSKRITWTTLAFMAFSTVWGFGNVLNGFVYFNGIQVIFSWILMFALYFIPYALMVGELGSAFKESGGGVSSWILKTTGPKLAYYAGWTYWACHITYIASKSSGGLKALSWAVFRNAETYDTFPTIGVQLITFAVLLFFCWVASRGLNPLKKLATIAGTSMFVMSILYIIMIFTARAINPGADYVSMDFSMKNLIPQFDVKYFTSLTSGLVPAPVDKASYVPAGVSSPVSAEDFSRVPEPAGPPAPAEKSSLV